MTVTELIDELDLKSKCRKRELVYTRYVIFKYLHENKYTSTAIAKMFDFKQHGTVIHALKKSHPYEEPAFTIVRLENFYEEIKPHA